VLRTPWALARSHADRAIADGGDPLGVDEVVISVANIYSKNLGPSVASDPGLLRHYWFVGCTEKLQAACDALADRLACPRRRVPLSNDARTRSTLPPGLRQQFDDASCADRQLYEAAQRIASGETGMADAGDRH